MENGLFNKEKEVIYHEGVGAGFKKGGDMMCDRIIKELTPRLAWENKVYVCAIQHVIELIETIKNNN